jgi:chaperonin cofactor prefoldin
VNIFKMNAKFYATLELRDWLSDLAEKQEMQQEIETLKTNTKGLEDRISELEKELYG